MANVTKIPEAYGYSSVQAFSGWIRSGVDSAAPDFLSYYSISYLMELPGASAISSAGLTVNAGVAGYYEPGTTYSDVSLTCVLYRGDWPAGDENEIGRATATGRFTENAPAELRFSFGSLNVQGTDKICFKVYTNAGSEQRTALSRPRVSASYSLPELSMSISPTTVLENGSVRLSFENRLGANVDIELWAGSTKVHSVTASGDTLDVACSGTWIPEGSTSTSISVRASDTLGRTASGNFTIRKYQASPATATAPKSATVSGDAAITFAWTVDETNGAQIKAELQYSRDGATWTDLATVNGSAKTVSVAAFSFPAGAVQWRVRATNSAYIVGNWSAAVSFTVSYPALGVSPSPSTVYQGGNVRLTIANRLERTIRVQLLHDSTLLATYSITKDAPVIQTQASWFESAGVADNTMRVDISATDSSLNRSAAGYFTLSKFVPSAATPTAPKSTTVSGDAAIPFSWSVDESAAAQTKAELQYSTDNVNWSALATVNGSGKTWSAAAYKFKQGTVYWRVRATNAFGVTGEWSAAVSFTVSYPALTVTAAPSTVNMGGRVDFTLTNRLGRSLTTQYKAGSTILHTGAVSKDTWYRVFVAQWFADAGATGSSLQVDVSATDDLGRTGTVRVTMAKTPMTIALSASIVYTGNKITVTLGNTAGRTYDLVFKYQSIVLHSITGSGDGARTVTCPDSWFSAASVSGRTMRVDVSATDDLGRTIAANFQLVQPQGSTFTPTAPKSTTADGAQQINFAWTVSDDWGSQTKAELQWSRDNAVWTNLATISGSAATWTAPAVSFPAGTIYWRGRVTNSFGVIGNWSSSVSFTVAYAAVSQAVPVNSPTSGIISGAVAEPFAITLQATGPVYEPFTVASAVFHWRAGESGDFTAVDMQPDGSGAAVSIPAGTFPSGVIQWYASAVDNAENASQTAVYTLTVRNAVVEAVPVSPISTVESGSGPIPFRWSYGSLDGSAQSAAELQWSTDGEAWTDLAALSGSATTWTAPADTFEAGTIYWRVRAANAAGTFGPWSAAVSFISFAAPHVDGVRGTGVPFSTISWQTTGQLAYEIEVDGKSYGPYFGEDVRAFTVPEPLEDGAHTVRVRAQNRYGLWSEWAEAEISVTNVPGPGAFLMTYDDDPIRLVPVAGALAPMITEQPRDGQGTILVIFDVRVGPAGFLLAEAPAYQWEYKDGNGPWTPVTDRPGAQSRSLWASPSAEISGRKYRCRVYNSVGEVYSREALLTYGPSAYGPEITGEFYADTGYFLFYRNGKLIGKSYGEITDRVAIGAVQYTAIQVLPGGYYTQLAAPQPKSIRVSAPAIGLLSGGDFLTLRLSEFAQRSQSFRRQRQVAYVQYAGATFPEAEIGEHEQASVSFDAAWLHDDADEANAFEAMLGKPVILKTPGGGLVVGVLDGYERRDPRFYRAYSCTLQQMEWRDFVDEP